MAELDSNEIIQIYKEATLKVSPTITTPEAIAYRKQVDQECAEILAAGGTFDMPNEVPG